MHNTTTAMEKARRLLAQKQALAASSRESTYDKQMRQAIAESLGQQLPSLYTQPEPTTRNSKRWKNDMCNETRNKDASIARQDSDMSAEFDALQFQMHNLDVEAIQAESAAQSFLQMQCQQRKQEQREQYEHETLLKLRAAQHQEYQNRAKQSISPLAMLPRNDDSIRPFGIANDSSRCYRNSLLQCLLANTNLMSKISEKKILKPRALCAPIDEFLFDIQNKMNELKRAISLDAELKSPNFLQSVVIGQNDPMQYLEELLAHSNDATTNHTASALQSQVHCIKMIHNQTHDMLHNSLDTRHYHMLKKSYNAKKTGTSEEIIETLNDKMINWNESSTLTGYTDRWGVSKTFSCTEMILLTKLPSILCIQNILRHKMHIQENMDISVAATGDCKTSEHCTYHLYACIMHVGAAFPQSLQAQSCGHYVSCVKKGHTWYLLVCIPPLHNFSLASTPKCRFL